VSKRFTVANLLKLEIKLRVNPQVFLAVIQLVNLVNPQANLDLAKTMISPNKVPDNIKPISNRKCKANKSRFELILLIVSYKSPRPDQIRQVPETQQYDWLTPYF
jgi:hypothetical protein